MKKLFSKIVTKPKQETQIKFVNIGDEDVNIYNGYKIMHTLFS